MVNHEFLVNPRRSIANPCYGEAALDHYGRHVVYFLSIAMVTDALMLTFSIRCTQTPLRGGACADALPFPPAFGLPGTVSESITTRILRKQKSLTSTYTARVSEVPVASSVARSPRSSLGADTSPSSLRKRRSSLVGDTITGASTCSVLPPRRSVASNTVQNSPRQGGRPSLTVLASANPGSLAQKSHFSQPLTKPRAPHLQTETRAKLKKQQSPTEELSKTLTRSQGRVLARKKTKIETPRTTILSSNVNEFFTPDAHVSPLAHKCVTSHANGVPVSNEENIDASLSKPELKLQHIGSSRAAMAPPGTKSAEPDRLDDPITGRTEDTPDADWEIVADSLPNADVQSLDSGVEKNDTSEPVHCPSTDDAEGVVSDEESPAASDRQFTSPLTVLKSADETSPSPLRATAPSYVPKAMRETPASVMSTPGIASAQIPMHESEAEPAVLTAAHPIRPPYVAEMRGMWPIESNVPLSHDWMSASVPFHHQYAVPALSAAAAQMSNIPKNHFTDWQLPTSTPFMNYGNTGAVPAGYTFPEWQEMRHAVNDLNRYRRQPRSPIPFGWAARARFNQPGKTKAGFLRGGSTRLNYEWAYANAYAGCCCPAWATECQTPRCINCGNRGHKLQQCDRPASFHPGLRESKMLSRYIETDHFRQLSLPMVLTYNSLLEARNATALPLDASHFMNCCGGCTHHRLDDVLRAIEYISKWQHPNSSGGPKHDWYNSSWAADFSTCPSYWTMMLTTDQTRVYFVREPLGAVQIHAHAFTDL